MNWRIGGCRAAKTMGGGLEVLPRGVGSATGLVNAPSFRLQNGHAEVPDFLPLSSTFGKCYEAISDKSQTRRDEGSHPSDGAVAFDDVADRLLSGAGDDRPLLAGDQP
jgi:hypothetical protein